MPRPADRAPIAFNFEPVFALKGRIDATTAREIVQQSLEIAADLCIYTNRSISIEEVGV